MNIRYLIASICLASGLSTHAAPLQTLYCSLLGNQDASPHYQTIVRTALQELNVPHADQVPVKKMNKLAPTFFGNDLSSFTTYGIWINEKLLDRCSTAEQTFALTHEAVHYARHDHQQVLTRFALLPCAYALLAYTSSTLPLSVTGQVATGIAASAATTYGFIEWVLRPLVKQQEKKADIEAINALNKRGDQRTVEQYKTHLNKLIAAGHGNYTDGWHPTIAEQVEYIK